MTDFFPGSAIFNAISAVNSVTLTDSITTANITNLKLQGAPSLIGGANLQYIYSLTNLTYGSYALSATESDAATIANFVATLAKVLINKGILR